jgi:poly(3-hydroxybutyrate) depolymerase
MISLSFPLVRILFALPFVAQADSGCGKPLPSGVQVGKTTNISIESGGLIRDYLLHVPKSYDGKKPVSLILSFHGRGKNASQQQDLSQFSNSTYNPNAIAVYPDGYMVRVFLNSSPS